VALIFEDLYRGRSVLPPHNVPSKPNIIRWDPSRPLTVDNIVVFDQSDADMHAKACWKETGVAAADPTDIWGKEVADIVRQRSAEARRVREWDMM